MLSNQLLILGSSILLVVFGGNSSIGAYRAENGNKYLFRVLELSFEELDEYVRLNCVLKRLSDADCMKKIESTQSLIPFANLMLGKLAANILIHVNTFDQCNKKAVDNMNAMLHGRPRKNYALFSEDGNSRLRNITDLALNRASGLCKSYLDKLFRTSEQKLATREQLYKLLNKKVVYNQEKLVDSLLNVSLSSNADTGKQLLQMREYQLNDFYSHYITKNLIEPCRAYVQNMSRLKELDFVFGYNLAFSQDEFEIFFRRLEMCQTAVENTNNYNNKLAREATIGLARRRRRKI